MKGECKRRVFAAAVAALIAVSGMMGSVSALAEHPAGSQTPTLASEFASVPNEARSRIRYWVPQAAMDEQDLRNDIRRITDMGYGCIEVVALSVSADKIGQENMWGSDNWNHMMKVILEEARRAGVSVDFTNGPQWPIAMPNITSADDPASLYELTYGLAEVPGGTVYDGKVPARTTVRSEGTTTLKSVLAYRRTADKTVDFDSMIDMTGQVDFNQNDQAASTVRFEAPDSGDWVLFSFWEQPAGQKTNGSYVIDHIGMAGAQAAVDYWENTLIPAISDDLSSCNSIFCDSLEYRVAMEWTRGFEKIFAEKKGYDITPYLPVIGQTGTYPETSVAGYAFTDSELTEKVRNDYLDVISFCYNEYHLKPMQQMAEKYGLNLRYQVAYNKPFEAETAALSVGIPEGEALGRRTIDNLRTMAGAVHLGDKPQYSFEGAAEGGNCYGQTWEDLMWWMKRSWAGGVNMQTLHGAGYTGGYHGKGNQNGAVPGTKWPGYALFGGVVSNLWNRVTSPEHASRYVDYMGRNNYILQKTNKVDVAVYRNEYLNNGMGGDGSHLYPDDGVLNSCGYSYEFISPTLLQLDNAVVTDGRLDEAGPAYKAIILHHQERIAPKTAQKLLSLVQAGLKLVVVGDAPGKNMFYSDELAGSSDQAVQEIMQQILAEGNAVQVSEYSEVPAALEQLRVVPDADYKEPADVLSMHTTDENGDYYYLYNYNKIPYDQGASQSVTDAAYPGIDKDSYLLDKTVSISFEGEGRPYSMNAWTGEISPIPEYTARDGKVDLTVSLKGDEAVLIALLTDEQAAANGLKLPETHACAPAAGGELAYSGELLTLKAVQSGAFDVVLGDFSTLSGTVGPLQDSFAVNSWNLRVNAVEAPENGSTSFYDSVWSSSERYELETLRPWSEISPELASASGIGTYKSSFVLDQGWEQGYGAYLDLGDVEDSFTIKVNGMEVPFPDQLDTRVDIGPYVRQGENQIEVQVASTLYNAVKHSSEKDYGLLGDRDGMVTVTPYACVTLEPVDSDKTILRKVLLYAENQFLSDEFANVIEDVQTSFTAALKHARVVSTDAAASQEEVDSAWKTLLTEIHKLGFVRGDTASLDLLIKAAEEFNVNISRYTPATVEPFATAFAAAKETCGDGNAMQEEVTAAENALLDAMVNLRFRADKRVLEEVLARAGTIDTTAYSAQSVAAFNAADDAAKETNADENATQDEVDKAAETLSAAMEGLVVTETGSLAKNGMAEGDAILVTGRASAKTGETVPAAVALSLLAIIGTGIVLSKKRR